MLLDKPLESHPLEPNVELPPPSLLKRKIIIKNKKKHHHHHHHHHKKNNAGANATANAQNNVNNSASGIRSSLNQINIPHSAWWFNFFFPFLFCFFELKLKTYTANAQQTQSMIPLTIDEESAIIPTGNGDAINHAPMLQVTICLFFPLQIDSLNPRRKTNDPKSERWQILMENVPETLSVLDYCIYNNSRMIPDWFIRCETFKHS